MTGTPTLTSSEAMKTERIDRNQRLFFNDFYA